MTPLDDLVDAVKRIEGVLKQSKKTDPLCWDKDKWIGPEYNPNLNKENV